MFAQYSSEGIVSKLFQRNKSQSLRWVKFIYTPDRLPSGLSSNERTDSPIEEIGDQDRGVEL